MSVALFPEIVVNGETIPSAAIAGEAQNHEAPKGKPGLAWRKAARALAIRALLLQEARRRDVAAEPAELAPGRRETEEEALIRGLLETAVAVEPPSDEAVRTEWVRDPERFRSPPLWEASHILCAADPRDTQAAEKAAARARKLCEMLAARPDDFARLAGSESDCDSRGAGGTLGQLAPGDCVPEFEAALRDLAPGQITPAPVQSRFGWHVIRLDARAEGRPLPFEAVRPHLVEALEKQAWARAARDFTQALVDAADIRGIDLEADRETRDAHAVA